MKILTIAGRSFFDPAVLLTCFCCYFWFSRLSCCLWCGCYCFLLCGLIVPALLWALRGGGAVSIRLTPPPLF